MHYAGEAHPHGGLRQSCQAFGRRIISGEVVGEYVPLLQAAVGHQRLWLAAYCNDFFGYLPTASVLAEGGYKTRGLITDVGYFSPEAEHALVTKVRQLARKAGRKVPY